MGRRIQIRRKGGSSPGFSSWTDAARRLLRHLFAGSAGSRAAQRARWAETVGVVRRSLPETLDRHERVVGTGEHAPDPHTDLALAYRPGSMGTQYSPPDDGGRTSRAWRTASPLDVSLAGSAVAGQDFVDADGRAAGSGAVAPTRGRTGELAAAQHGRRQRRRRAHCGFALLDRQSAPLAPGALPGNAAALCLVGRFVGHPRRGFIASGVILNPFIVQADSFLARAPGTRQSRPEPPLLTGGWASS